MTAWHQALSKKFQARRSNKYGAKRIEVAGESYDSKAEHEMHTLLKLREKAGDIKNIRRQMVIQLTRFVKWRADFVVFSIKKDQDVIVEFKGLEDARFRVIKQLIREFAPMPVEIWKKQGNRIYLDQEIQPDAGLK